MPFDKATALEVQSELKAINDAVAAALAAPTPVGVPPQALSVTGFIALFIAENTPNEADLNMFGQMGKVHVEFFNPANGQKAIIWITDADAVKNFNMDYSALQANRQAPGDTNTVYSFWVQHSQTGQPDTVYQVTSTPLS